MIDLAFVRKHAVRQPNGYWCGPCALRAAFLCYGERVRLSRIAKLAGTTTTGTETHDMAHAAEILGYTFGRPNPNSCADLPFVFSDHRLAKQALWQCLDDLVPVVLIVDARDHYITALHATAKKVTVADSSFYNTRTPVVYDTSWTRLLSRMVVWTPSKTKFDFYPVRPR